MGLLYQDRVRRQVVAALEHGALCVCDLFAKTQGAFPQDVKQALDDLVTEGTVVLANGTATLAAPARPSACPGDPSLALRALDRVEPHPVDYDWRFSPGTIEWLATEFVSRHLSRARWACLGTPTLFVHLRALGFDAVLYERNRSIVEAIRDGRAICQDLTLPVPGRSFDAVVADPPWYADYYKIFLSRASEILVDDGFLFLAVLPRLTRPSACADRLDVQRTALALGFEICEVRPATLAYDTPAFEKRSLENAGVACKQWRRGDLFVLQRVWNEAGAPLVQPDDYGLWQEYAFGSVRVKVRRGSVKKKGALLMRLPEATLVSRRSPLRPDVDLWTSQNDAYRVGDLDLLHRVLRELQAGISPQQLVDELPTVNDDDQASLACLLLNLWNARLGGQP